MDHRHEHRHEHRRWAPSRRTLSDWPRFFIAALVLALAHHRQSCIYARPVTPRARTSRSVAHGNSLEQLRCGASACKWQEETQCKRQFYKGVLRGDQHVPYYESVFVARPDISAAQVEALTESMKEIVSGNGGAVTKAEYWGLKTLAYRIKKSRKGHYSLLNLDAPAAAVKEMERNLGLNEDVIRFMTVRVDELEEEPSVMMRNKGARDDRPRRDHDDRPPRDGAPAAPAVPTVAEEPKAAEGDN
jgi:small subunit ribosomal protein S6